jgi:hypothetical protein
MAKERNRTTFAIPGFQDRRTLKGADRNWHYGQQEVHGPTYQIRPSEQRHEGDPTQDIVQQIALREPPEYQHPQRLGRDTLDPGGPRVLPVSGAVSHGSKMSRTEAFEQAQRAAAAEMSFAYGLLGWKDRRREGRRFRPTDTVQDMMGPQEPYPPAPHGSEIPFEKFVRGW